MRRRPQSPLSPQFSTLLDSRRHLRHLAAQAPDSCATLSKGTERGRYVLLLLQPVPWIRHCQLIPVQLDMGLEPVINAIQEPIQARPVGK